MCFKSGPFCIPFRPILDHIMGRNALRNGLFCNVLCNNVLRICARSSGVPVFCEGIAWHDARDGTGCSNRKACDSHNVGESVADGVL